MASPRLNPEEKKDLDKFTKFLALKAAQIIVQSRLGQKICTRCDPNSGKDWFNLKIKDIPEVTIEAKRACEAPTSRMTLCVEITLRTVEGDTMMLETWNLGVVPDDCNGCGRVSHSVYNRMGMLLRSLLTVTRVTPAYKLSRRQSPDSYVICYRIYMGEPQLHQLGEGYKEVAIGEVCTPIGKIQLSVSYRTKMTISPQRDSSIMLKSDHFAPKSNSQINDERGDDLNNSSMTETLKVGAFADETTNKTELDERLIVPETPFESLLIPPKAPSTPVPLVSNVEEPSKEVLTEKVADSNGDVTPKADSRRSSCSFASAPDDFLLVDLKTPFANTNSGADLGNFYRECQQAPPLHDFEVGEPLSELTKQLEDLEMCAPKYQELLSTLTKTKIAQ